MNEIFLDECDLSYIPSTRGPDVLKFEKTMAEYLKVDDCVAVNSGTSALHLSLLACGVGPKDTVIVPATTFVATANAVLYTGARVKLVDIDLKSWNLPALIKEKEYKKAKAIVPVSLYGNRVEIPHYNVSHYECNPYHQNIILDLAEAIHLDFGTDKYCCYSFNGNKTMTTGAGGLITGPDLNTIRKLIRPAYSNHLAYNYGMAAENARLGLKQILKLSDYIKKKEEINSAYRNYLHFLRFQGNIPGPYWMTACLFPEHIDIPTLQLRLEMRGIPTRRIFKPLNHYKHLPDGKIHKNSEYIFKHGLVLPSSTKNSEENIYEVCKAIKKLI